MFGEPNNVLLFLDLLDRYSIDDILVKLEIDPVEVLQLLEENGYNILSLYEEVINGNG